MVDEILLKKEIDLYKISGITIKGILQLCELFVVPYRTMAKRLREIELISEHELEKFLSESEESINKYRKMYSFVLREPDERVVMDNLVELSDLTPEDLGMEKKSDYEFPSAVQQLSKLISENKVVLVNESSLNSKDRAIYDAAYKNLEKVMINPKKPNKNKGEACSLAYAKATGIPVFATDEMAYSRKK